MKKKDVFVEEVSPAEARRLCRSLVHALPQFFGENVPESTYEGLEACTNLGAFVDLTSFGGETEVGRYALLSVLPGEGKSDGEKNQKKLVGLLSFYMPYPPQAHILWMGVHPSVQGCGIGGQLLVSLTSHIKAIGGKLISTEILSPEAEPVYHATLMFYQAQGFLPVIDFVPEDHPQPMILLVKSFS